MLDKRRAMRNEAIHLAIHLFVKDEIETEKSYIWLHSSVTVQYGGSNGYVMSEGTHDTPKADLDWKLGKGKWPVRKFERDICGFQESNSFADIICRWLLR